MSTNRVLCYLGHDSQHQKARRQLLALRDLMEHVESASNGVVEFLVPSTDDLMDDPDVLIRYWTERQPDKVSATDDIPMHVISELRRIAGELTEAADGIEGVAI